jgi:3-hydroxyacyl-CoA dehydrogenase/enoyl-CoA hydratase/3-hydroxybutyryl-CoA epimerase
MTEETRVDDRQWSLEQDADGIAWLVFDKPGASANSLSRAAMEELDARLAEIERMAPVGLVIASAKSGFIAGADVKEFGQVSSPEEAVPYVRAAHAILDRLERLACPTVASINGYCLGGGLELALACRYRVCADDASVVLGVPEVLLGIHPGFGGTVRLVRLIGVSAAMDMMLTGRNLRPEKALRIGLVDSVVPAAKLSETAASLVRARPRPAQPPLRERLLSAAPLRGFVANKVRQQVARRARPEHYPAPYAIVELWRKHGANPRTAYEAEAQSVARLVCTQTSRNLVRVFFLQERLKSLGGSSVPRSGNVHVVGAGVMGGDIAAWCALRGFTVTLQDRTADLVRPAIERARALFEKRERKPGQAAAWGERLRPDVEGAGISDADAVIEAIIEDADAKRALYAELEPRMKPEALLATNTSSIALESLNDVLADPGRLVGLHFFNPVAQMPLVEVVESSQTTSAVRAAALAFARGVDKLPLPCRSAPGFLVNRVLMPYLTEAMLAAEQGIPLALIDQRAEEFGMPIGPIELADTVGLDVCLHVGRILADASGRPPPEALVPLVEAGSLGRKSGKGLYEWQAGKAVKPPAGSAAAPEDLADRLLLPMVNEAVAVLREGVVADEDLVDAGVIFGSGFAPFRGGPLRYARERGCAEVVARLQELEAVHGPRFRPDPGWEQFGGGGL